MTDEMPRYPELTPWSNTTLTPDQVERASAAKLERTMEAVRARQKRDEQRAKEREEALQEAGRAKLAEYQGTARQAWLRNGGTEAEFQSAWPRLRTEWLIEQSQRDPVEEKAAKLRASGAYGRFG